MNDLPRLEGAPVLPDGWFYRVESDPFMYPDWYLVSIYKPVKRWWGCRNQFVSEAETHVRGDSVVDGAQEAWKAAQKMVSRAGIVGDYR